MIAAFVMVKPLDSATELLQRREWGGPVASKPLWEGEGELLPVQPSSLVFRFLHDLVTEMRSAGEDVWTPAAVKCVKAGACNKLWAAMEAVLQGRGFGEAPAAVSPVAVKEKGAEEEDDEEEDGDEEAPPVEEVGDPKKKAENGPEKEPSANGDSTANATTEDHHHPASTSISTSTTSTSTPPAPELANGGAPTAAPATAIPASTPTPEPQSQPEPEPEPVKRITRDWTLQLLFDVLYLDEALHRKRRRGSTNGSSVTSLVGKVDSFIGAKVTPPPRYLYTNNLLSKG